MTLPTPDAQSAGFRARPSLVPNPTYSMPKNPHAASEPSLLPSAVPQTEPPQEPSQDRAIDFASHSWDLATGGLKTLTAKREMPFLVERRPTGQLAEPVAVPRSYAFLLIILVCLVIMLVSGGVVLFVMLQP